MKEFFTTPAPQSYEDKDEARERGYDTTEDGL